MEIGPSVLEKMFEGFLPYMGVAAILAPIQRGFTQNLALIGQEFSEKKMSEHCGRQTDGLWTIGILLSLTMSQM